MFNEKDKIEYTPQEVFGKSDRVDISHSSKTIAKSKLLARGAFIGAAALVLLMLIAFLVSMFFTGSGSFTVKIGNLTNGAGGQLSLSETSGFANKTTRLEGIPMDNMDNTTYSQLPLETLDTGEGSHNGENYVAFSFYLKNTGTQALDYDLSLDILNVTRGVDAAIRVMLFVNGEHKIYAKPAADGNVESYPENCLPFESSSVVTAMSVKEMQPGRIDRYTVVIWLEGEDPECVDNVIGGIMQMQMTFQISERA